MPSNDKIVIRKIIRVLRTHAKNWALCGGLAYNHWVEPRTTLDMDVLADIPPESEKSFLADMKKNGFRPDRLQRTFFFKCGVYRLWHDRFCVDILLAKDIFEMIALERSVPAKLAGVPFRALSPEDLILQKLVAGRPKDIADALNLLRYQRGKMNRRYLTGWAKRLKVENKLTLLDHFPGRNP